jgi:hypothetical protein
MLYEGNYAAQEGTVIVSSGSTLRVHSEPDENSSVLYNLNNGTVVMLECSSTGTLETGSQSTTDQWDEIDSSTYGVGYASHAYIACDDVVPSCDSEQVTGQVVVETGNTLKVHSTASTSSSVLYSLNCGDVVELTCVTPGETVSGSQGTTSDWFEINSNGFASAAYIASSGRPPACSSPPPPPLSDETIGVDISAALSSSTASCFASNGVSYIVARGYRSSGQVDTACCGSLNAAASASIPTRDAYIFPCPTCSKSALTQVQEMYNALKSGCSWSGKIWLDIEGSQYWSGSYSTNQAFYSSLVDACKSTVGPSKCGVYSGASQWSALFGSLSFSYGADLPLWYAHYDNLKSFSDFSTFGGWSSPVAKQYQGDVSLCSFGVDMDWAPYGFDT